MTFINKFANIINYMEIEKNNIDKNQKDKNNIKLEGRVLEAMPNTFFKILLQDNREILGFLSGKMRMNKITILPGDKVTVEMTPYDDKKGRIIYRLK